MKTIKYLIIATALATTLGPVSVYAMDQGQELQEAAAAQAAFTAEQVAQANELLSQALDDGDTDRVNKAIELGANVNQENSGGYTPLRKAILYKNIKMVLMLLAAGANVNQSDTDGVTPLIKVLSYIPLSLEMVNIVLKAGADVNQPDRCGNTPLMVAINHNNTVLVELLLNHGATETINQASQYGTKPLVQAAFNQNVKMVKMLVFHGSTVRLDEELNYRKVAIETMKPVMEQAREARRLVIDCCLTRRDVQIFAPHCTPLAELGEAIRGYTDPLGGVQDPELRELMQKQIIKNRQE
ncbi:MAG: ankyrin repeat domain-containing protein, partial [Candidatus Dependentiae bacterium]|nr:ankyrin repeat domain-containing protein [Candidatus Dependentiae bacterium]